MQIYQIYVYEVKMMKSVNVIYQMRVKCNSVSVNENCILFGKCLSLTVIVFTCDAWTSVYDNMWFVSTIQVHGRNIIIVNIKLDT